MSPHVVKVRSDSVSGIPTHLWIDDKEIHGVTAIDYNIKVGEIPVFTIILRGFADTEVDAIAIIEKEKTFWNAAKKL